MLDKLPLDTNIMKIAEKSGLVSSVSRLLEPAAKKLFMSFPVLEKEMPVSNTAAEKRMMVIKSRVSITYNIPIPISPAQMSPSGLTSLTVRDSVTTVLSKSTVTTV